MTENIFNEFIVVDEKAFTDLIIEREYCYDHYVYNCNKCSSARQNKTNFVGLAHFDTFQFILHNHEKTLEIKCIGSASELSDLPLAQIVQWQWDGNGKQMINENKMIKAGETFKFSVSSLSSIVIRILKKREKCAENLNPPPITLPDDKLTVEIGDKKVNPYTFSRSPYSKLSNLVLSIVVSSSFFVSVSPVFNRMLSVEMKEKQQRSLTLNELGVDMEQFMEFVEAISITAFHKPILPNPKNVLTLLKLADYFQVDWLKSRCEAHLINCPEIPMIDRFLMIDLYRLGNFKNSFLNLSVDKLRAFYKANRDQLSPGQSAVSDQLLAELVNRLCG